MISLNREKKELLDELKREILSITNSIDDNNFFYDEDMSLWYDGLSGFYMTSQLADIIKEEINHLNKFIEYSRSLEHEYLELSRTISEDAYNKAEKVVYNLENKYFY